MYRSLALGPGAIPKLMRMGPAGTVKAPGCCIAQVFPRNGMNLFLERECSDFDGYFEQMWNVHFPAGRPQRARPHATSPPVHMVGTR